MFLTQCLCGILLSLNLMHSHLFLLLYFSQLEIIPMCDTLYFIELNLFLSIFFFLILDYFFNLSRLLSIQILFSKVLADAFSLVLSANLINVLPIPSSRSLMKILNNTGSRTGLVKSHSVFTSSLTGSNCSNNSFTFMVYCNCNSIIQII